MIVGGAIQAAPVLVDARVDRVGIPRAARSTNVNFGGPSRASKRHREIRVGRLPSQKDKTSVSLRRGCPLPRSWGRVRLGGGRR